MARKRIVRLLDNELTVRQGAEGVSLSGAKTIVIDPTDRGRLPDNKIQVGGTLEPKAGIDFTIRVDPDTQKVRFSNTVDSAALDIRYVPGVYENWVIESDYDIHFNALAGAQIHFDDPIYVSFNDPGDKIYLYGPSYKIGISTLTLDLTSDQDIAFHSDTVPNLFNIYETGDALAQRDLRATRDVIAGDKFRFFSNSVGDKIYLYSTLYKLGIDTNTLVVQSDRDIRMGSDLNPDSFLLNGDAGDLTIEGTFYGSAAGLTNLPSHNLITAHTAGGLTAGQVLRATGASSFAFQAIQASDLPSHTHTWANLSDVTPTLTQINYVAGVTSAIQTQLDGKAPNNHAITAHTGLPLSLANGGTGTADSVYTTDTELIRYNSVQARLEGSGILSGSVATLSSGLLPIAQGGNNNATYSGGQFLQYDSGAGKINSSGYTAASFHAANTCLPLAGGTMTGDITMGGYSLFQVDTVASTSDLEVLGPAGLLLKSTGADVNLDGLNNINFKINGVAKLSVNSSWITAGASLDMNGGSISEVGSLSATGTIHTSGGMSCTSLDLNGGAVSNCAGVSATSLDINSGSITELGGIAISTIVGNLAITLSGSTLIYASASETRLGQPLNFTSSATGRKIRLWNSSDLYGLGISLNTVDYYSDENHKFHSDTLADAVVINATAGHLDIKGTYYNGGTAGVTGTFASPTSITVKGGIVTAVS